MKMYNNELECALTNGRYGDEYIEPIHWFSIWLEIVICLFGFCGYTENFPIAIIFCLIVLIVLTPYTIFSIVRIISYAIFTRFVASLKKNETYHIYYKEWEEARFECRLKDKELSRLQDKIKEAYCFKDDNEQNLKLYNWLIEEEKEKTKQAKALEKEKDEKYIAWLSYAKSMLARKTIIKFS